MHRSSLDFKLVQRVCLLQQALDQALASLAEMRDQIEDKHLIETQLIHTEKYANVQQQAIAQLKQHLTQFTEVQHHLLGVMAYRLNELIDGQQVDFNRLQILVQQGETELQTYLQYMRGHCTVEVAPDRDAVSEAGYLALKAEVMIARSVTVSLSRQLAMAKHHIHNLTSALNNHHLNLTQIVHTIQAMMSDLDALDIFAEGPQKSLVEGVSGGEAIDTTLHEHPEDMAVLEGTLRQQERRIHELEAVLMEQFEQQTQLKQRFQALAVERDYYKRQWEARYTSQPTSTPALPESGVPVASEVVDALGAGSGGAQPRLRSQPPPIQPLRLQEGVNDPIP